MVAPAGAVPEGRLERGVQVLERWGLRVMLGDGIRARQAYLAGEDGVRRSDLQRMLDDPTVRALFCARGGYGSQRIVPAIDWDAVRDDPKPVVGYSDVTAVHGALARAGVASFHGPMVATDLARGLTASSVDALWSAIADGGAAPVAPVPTAIRGGRARGRLLGGCLSVFVTTLGTPWAVDTTGAVLFLEDVHEWPYRLDRLLLQLRQAGTFDRVAGVVCGTLATCPSANGVDPFDVVRDAFTDAPFPVGFGLPAGHSSAESDVENLTLPLGIDVELDVDAGRLVALEPAVV